MTFFKKKEPAKPQFEQNSVNTALQAAITPIGLEFKRNEFLLGENYCRIYVGGVKILDRPLVLCWYLVSLWDPF